jgi:hypothetical protein
MCTQRDELETRLHGSFKGRGARPAANRQEAAEIVVGLRLVAEQARVILELAEKWEAPAFDVFQNIDLQNELREDHAAGKHEDTSPPLFCPDCEPTSLEDMLELGRILKDEAA